MNNYPLLTRADYHSAAPGSAQRRAAEEMQAGSRIPFVGNSAEELDMRVAQQPRQLAGHLQRIYYHFNNDSSEALYAAIVDLLVILKNGGNSLAWRMINGCRSRLTPEQVATLQAFMQNPARDYRLLPGNGYALFSKGYIGTNQLIEKQLSSALPSSPENHEDKPHLEEALLQRPFSLELHRRLLAVYKFDKDRAGFERMRLNLQQLAYPLPEDWEELEHFFKKLPEPAEFNPATSIRP